MTRPADLTRQALITAALAVFAEKGFTAGSIRDITRRAKANGAAVNYHFGGKEGLYREVLRSALAAFENNARADDAKAETLPRREALARFVRQQLVPLTKRDQFSRYLRLFAWEHVSASDVFRDFIATEELPILSVAGRIVRRYLPEDAGAEEVAVTTLWLIQQPTAFVRDSEHLARPPLNLTLDEAFVDRLAATLTALIDAGLSARSARAS
ncbi:MAG: TetR/AcrR family transcriptional regulator [Microvirga sp.]